MIFRKWRKKQHNGRAIAQGLYMEQEIKAGSGRLRVNYLIRGILVFLVVFGSLGGFLSAFGMEYNPYLAALCLLPCALYFALLFSFRKKIWKDIGYIIFFVFYVVGIFYLRTYANSGFAAVINAVRSRGEYYFDLEPGPPFKEIIENPYVTITVIFVFVGIFEIIVLNIFVSGYMSLKLAAFMAFTVYAVPLYFRIEPGMIYVFCMFLGLAGIYIFKNNGRTVYAAVLPAIFGMVALLGISTLFFGQEEWNRHYVENAYKTATREGVSGFVSVGFLMFFQDAFSSGGMNGGQLGDISAVRPTGAVHLRVTYTPYDSSPLYLKAFTGFTYKHNTWKNRISEADAAVTPGLSGSLPGIKQELFAGQMQQLKQRYKKDKKRYARGVMKITNIAADGNYYYLPYLPEAPKELWDMESGTNLCFPQGIGVEVPYYPLVGPDAAEEKEFLGTDTYVPPENVVAVAQACRNAGTGYRRADAIERVEQYLKEAYSYSYNPGKTPEDEDVVNYFLETNKKGVCAHFASAATLMLRWLGYPARYVEGYAVGYGSLLNGKLKDERYEDYYDGYAPIGETAVVEVDVTDADAHAWVEVYEEGRGWRILDPTPASTESNSDGGVWRSLQGLFSGSGDGDAGEGMSFRFLKNGRWTVAGTILAVVCMICLAGYGIRKYIIYYRLLHSRDRRSNLLFAYRRKCRKMEKRNPEFAALSTPAERIPYLAAQKDTGYSAEELVRLMEAALFGPEEPGDEDYQVLRRFLRK